MHFVQLTPWRQTQGSSPCSQEPATSPYSEPTESTPYPPSQFPSDPFWSHPPIYTLVFGVVSFLRLYHQNLLHSSMRAICPAHLILLDLICLRILSNECKLWISSLCNFLHSPVISSLLSPKFLLRTLRLCSFLNVRETKINNPYKTFAELWYRCKG
jgi:hypothetical protein